MKAKILTFLGLIIAAISLSIAFGSSPVFAAGEKYTWIDENNIDASEGLYLQIEQSNDSGVLRFKKQSTGVYTANIETDYGDFDKCSGTIKLTVGADYVSGRYSFIPASGTECEGANKFDKLFVIANPSKGPSMEGSNIDYRTINCAVEYAGDESIDRCIAVQKCVVDKNLAVLDCLRSWNTCIINATDGGVINTAKRQVCAADVAAGKMVKPNTAGPAGASGGDTTSCGIDGVGWIVCPIVTFLSKIVDAAYGFVSSLLKVQPLVTSGQSEIYDAWSIMRNFANVAFVIAFLVIIFSQLTSVGITNYGIKKMLPRLIVAAILVNASFWICAGAVDLSNILGTSMNALLKNVAGGITIPDAAQFGGSTSGWEGIAGSLLVGGAAVGITFYVGLSALLPALLAALVSIVTVFVVLSLRQALIILLIVISPLAFVAYLLPNTESLFKKWRELFQTLLLMFPIISLIFGASGLASKIVMSSASEDSDYEIAIKIMGALIAVIPLAITPIVMKTAGGVLNRFGVSLPGKGLIDRAKKGAQGYRANRQALRDTNALNGKRRFGGSFVRRKAKRNAVIASRQAGLKDATTNFISGEAEKNGLFAKQMAGGGLVTNADERTQNAVVASAIAQKKKAFQEDVSNMEALVKVRFKDPGEALQDAINRGDKTQAVAAQNLLYKKGGSGISQFRDIVQASEASSDMGVQAGLSEVTGSLKGNINDNHGQAVKAKAADLTSWAGGSNSLSTSQSGSLSDIDLAGQHASSMAKMASATKEDGSPLITGAQARSVMNDPRVSANLNPEQKQILSDVAGGDLRKNPTKEELTIAHEDAQIQDALHDMNTRV